MKRIDVPTWYYRHHDADFTLDVPAEGFGGWSRAELPLSLRHTALAVMHAWDAGTREQYPGWHRLVEYLPRAYRIGEEVLPPILDAFRRAGVQIFHIADSRDYCKKYPGYELTQSLEIERPVRPRGVEPDEVLRELQNFKYQHVNPGEHNADDIARGSGNIDFYPTLKPRDNEPIARDSEELLALCRERGINHIIYTGFAIDCCLLISPGGMLDMSRYGVMCSVIRQATTAVENRESAREELVKQIALWRVALFFGFVYDDIDLLTALKEMK